MTERQFAPSDSHIFVAARHVGIPGEAIDRFVKTLEMCGYRIAPRSETATRDAAQMAAGFGEALALTEKATSGAAPNVNDAIDAARYRWLREVYPLQIGLMFGSEAGRNPDDELDAEIDQAMKGGDQRNGTST